MRISFRALLTLQPKLATEGVGFSGASMALDEGSTVADLIARCGLEPGEVEAVFVNHVTVERGQELHDRDAVVLVPPGVPGPHRYLLGIAKAPKAEE